MAIDYDDDRNDFCSVCGRPSCRIEHTDADHPDLKLCGICGHWRWKQDFINERCDNCMDKCPVCGEEGSHVSLRHGGRIVEMVCDNCGNKEEVE